MPGPGFGFERPDGGSGSTSPDDDTKRDDLFRPRVPDDVDSPDSVDTTTSSADSGSNGGASRTGGARNAARAAEAEIRRNPPEPDSYQGIRATGGQLGEQILEDELSNDVAAVDVGRNAEGGFTADRQEKFGDFFGENAPGVERWAGEFAEKHRGVTHGIGDAIIEQADDLEGEFVLPTGQTTTIDLGPVTRSIGKEVKRTEPAAVPKDTLEAVETGIHVGESFETTPSGAPLPTAETAARIEEIGDAAGSIAAAAEDSVRANPEASLGSGIVFGGAVVTGSAAETAVFRGARRAGDVDVDLPDVKSHAEDFLADDRGQLDLAPPSGRTRSGGGGTSTSGETVDWRDIGRGRPEGQSAGVDVDFSGRGPRATIDERRDFAERVRGEIADRNEEIETDLDADLSELKAGPGAVTGVVAGETDRTETAQTPALEQETRASGAGALPAAGDLERDLDDVTTTIQEDVADITPAVGTGVGTGTGTRQDTGQDLTPDVRSDIDTDVRTDIDIGQDIDTDVRTDIDTDVRTDVDVRQDIDQHARLDLDTDQWFDLDRPRTDSSRRRLRLPDLDLDNDRKKRRRRGRGELLDEEFTVEVTPPEDILSGEAFDVDFDLLD